MKCNLAIHRKILDTIFPRVIMHTMQRRWIIRSVLLIPLAICLAAWTWNCFCDEWLSYSDSSHRQTTLAIADGDICFAWRLQTSFQQGWHYDHLFQWPSPNYRRIHFSILIGHKPEDQITETLSLVGIHIGTVSAGEYFAYIPIWLTTLILLIAAAISWWRTRQYPLGTAFTIDIK